MARAAIRPLTVGNILTVGLILYHSKLKAYGLIGLRAMAWMLLMVAAILLILGMMVAAFVPAMASPNLEGFNGGMFGVGVLLILPAIPLGIFCSAKYLYNEALIARHAYLRLVEQPEDFGQTNQALRRKLWQFWLVRLLVTLIWIAAMFALWMLTTIVSLPLQAFLLTVGANELFLNLLFWLYLLTQIAGWVGQMWVTGRFFLAETAIALEENVGAAKALDRSWMLTRQNDWRVVLVLGVGTILTTPLYGLCFLVPFVVLGTGLIPIMPTLGTAESVEGFVEGYVPWVLWAIGLYFALLTIVNVAVIPFWQTMKAAVYYDLRSRRDGMGLSLRHSL
jgi:hypothetical protein